MLVAALVMLAAGSFYFFGYRPEAEKSVNLESDHAEKRLFLQKTLSIVDAKRADLAAEGASADTAEREAAVPDEPDREGILLDLEQAAKSSGAQIREVVFEEPGNGGQAAAAAETLPTAEPSNLGASSPTGADSQSAFPASADGFPAAMGDPGLLNGADFNSTGFTAMSLRLNLRGTLAQVKTFAAALQAAERLYVVRSFEYGKEEALESETAVFQLLTLYR